MLSSFVVAQFTCVGPFVRPRPWLLKFFSMPTTRPTFNNLSGRTCSFRLLLCGPRALAVSPNFRRCVSCREPHRPFSSLHVALPSVSRVVFQRCFEPCLGCYQLVFLSYRYVEIAAILCLLSPRRMFSRVSSCSESLDRVVLQAFVYGLGHAPIPAKINY